MSLFGSVRLASSLSVLDKLCLNTGNVAKFEGWSMGWDSGSSKLRFLADGVVKPPLTITPTGGELHGTWTVESIVSASDRRLKHEISELASALPKKNIGNIQGVPTASRLLQALNPMHLNGESKSTGAQESQQQQSRILFDAEDVEKVLPDLVRPAPGLESSSQSSQAGGSSVGKGILYQDFLALLTLAAQERQRLLEEHQIREHEENMRIQAQDEVIDMLEKQVNALRGRFRRLRSRHPIPPQVT